MRNFFNDDDFNGDFGDDFFGRWEEFNRLMHEKEFRNKFQKDLEDLMRSMMSNDNQYGFKIIPLFGDMDSIKKNIETKKGKDEEGEWETKSWTSPDGSFSYKSFTRSSGYEDLFGNDMTEGLKERRKKQTEESRKLQVLRLQKTLDYLVENEEYEKAAEIKKLIDDLKSDKKED